jgi:hypothetical protein
MELIKKGMNGKAFTLELMMRGTRDGFSAKMFHELCDGKGSTVTMIESEAGKIFGGYTSLSWMSYDCKYQTDPDAFIFSLSNKSIHKQHRFKNFSVSHDKSQLAVFGRGNDICIYDNCNTRKDNFSNLGDTYDSNGLKFETFDAKSYMAGACLFKVKELEVFRINFQ